MAKIETKTEAVIHLSNEEVEEIRGWLGIIDWEAHPLAEEIYGGLGGNTNDPPTNVSATTEFGGTVIFTKEDR